MCHSDCNRLATWISIIFFFATVFCIFIDVELSLSYFFPTGLVVVDCTASSETIEVLKQVIDSGCCVVLANKKPLTSSMVTARVLLQISVTMNAC